MTTLRTTMIATSPVRVSIRVAIIATLTGLGLALSGCSSGSLDPKQISAPHPTLMRPPAPFPPLKEGEDARAALIKAAEVHATNTRRLRGLQDYVRTVRQ